jgi:3-dehydroquinate synthase
MSEPEKDVYRVTVTPARPFPVAPYHVLIGCGLLDEAGRRVAEVCSVQRHAVIADSQVADLYGERLLAALAESGGEARLIRFAAGEWNKTREAWGELTDSMLRWGFGRDSAVIALGGGVTGDLAGFVAATYMRGLPVVQVPTTLTAMLDSSVGEVTGLDTQAGKSLVGADHAPALVLVDPALLKTLPAPQMSAGLATAIKHGLILDAGYLDEITVGLESILGREPEGLAATVKRSVEIKADVMGRDSRETGYRTVLDFGHTVAGAVGTLTGYGWLYGEALAVGMLAEARIGEAAGITAPGTAGRIQEMLEAARLPLELDPDITAERFFKALELVGKRRGARPQYTLLTEVGRVAGSRETGWGHAVEDDLVQGVLFG